MRAHAPDDLEGLDREYEHDAGAGQAHGPNGHAEAPILDPRDPLSSAGTFVATFYVHEAGRTIHHHRGGFYSWDGACYCETPDREIRAHLYDFLGQARVIADGRQHHFKPTAPRVNDVLDAIKALVHLPDRTGTPSWLDGRPSRTSRMRK